MNMAGTIHKLTKAGNLIFPATISDAVVHPQTGVTLTDMISEYNVSLLFPTSGVSGGSTYTLSGAISLLNSKLTADEKVVGVRVLFKTSTTPSVLDSYTFTGTTFSSVDSWTKNGIYTDDAPTQGSTNLLTSGVIYDSLYPAAYLDDEVQGEESSTPEFDPYTDTVHTVEQTLSTAQKEQVLENFGLSKTLGEDIPSVGYYICNTGSDWPNKEVTVEGYGIYSKHLYRIKMNQVNSVNSCNLIVSNENGDLLASGPLFYNGVRAGSGNSWYAGEVLDVYYDGTNFQATSLSFSREYNVSEHNTHEVTTVFTTTRVGIVSGEVTENFDTITDFISDKTSITSTRTETQIGTPEDTTVNTPAVGVYNSEKDQTTITWVSTRTVREVGTNTFTFSEAVSRIPGSYRKNGAKCSFISVSGKTEYWALISADWSEDVQDWRNYTNISSGSSTLPESSSESKEKYLFSPLTITMLESGDLNFSIWKECDVNDVVSVSYSLDGGETWITTENTGDKTEDLTISVPGLLAGDTVLWKGIAETYAPIEKLEGALNDAKPIFSSTGNFSLSGNIMSLLYGDTYKNKTSLSRDYSLGCLFLNCDKIIDASNLILPATTLSIGCYVFMFRGCTSLTTAPELPATTLAEGCYGYMFYGCTSLTTAPELPATTLTDYCYEGMFQGCSNLNYIRVNFIELPYSEERYVSTENWVEGVSSSGVFVRPDNSEWDYVGQSGIPTGWTVVKESEYEVVRKYELIPAINQVTTSIASLTAALNQEKEARQGNDNYLWDLVDKTTMRVYRDGGYNMNDCLYYGYYFGCTSGRPSGSASEEKYALEVEDLGQRDISHAGEDYTSSVKNTIGTEGGWAGTFGYYSVEGTSLVERYYGNYPGPNEEVCSQVVSGLLNGTYSISFYAAASSTVERDTWLPEPNLEIPAIDIKANGTSLTADRAPVSVKRTAVESGSDLIIFSGTVTVTNGTLDLRVYSGSEASANWFILKCTSLIAQSGVVDSFLAIKQTCHSSINPDRIFQRIVLTKDKSIHTAPTTTYGEWSRVIPEISDGSITTDKLADQSVTYEKISPDVSVGFPQLIQVQSDENNVVYFEIGVIKLYNSCKFILGFSDVDQTLLPEYVKNLSDYTRTTLDISDEDGIIFRSDDGTVIHGQAEGDIPPYPDYSTTVRINITFSQEAYINTTNVHDGAITEDKISPVFIKNLSDKERVIATALADLDSKKSDKDDVDELQDDVDELQNRVTELEDSELVVATALTDLDSRKSDKDDVDELQNRVIVLEENPTVTFSINPTTVYAGEAQSVTPNVKYNTESNLNADIIGWALSDSGSFIGSITNASSYTTASSQTWSEGPAIVSLEGRVGSNISGINWTSGTETNLNVVRPIIYGWGTSSVVATHLSGNLPTTPASQFYGATKPSSASFNTKSTYSGTSSLLSGDYFYIFVPTERDDLDVDKFTMGGAPVAMVKYDYTNSTWVADNSKKGSAWASGDNVLKTTTYSVYRTEASYTGTNITLNIKAE